MSTDVILSLKDVHKRFGDYVAVDGVSMDIHRGEFVTLLGPSGCGKTTILRMVAGFESPTQGTLSINGRSMQGVAPYEREVGLVFQNLALFPHLTVSDNVAFGLRVRQVGPAEIEERVGAALDLVGLAGFGRRGIGQLSGGQRQRVALARSLVIRPALLLLDEPLSALDLKLRRQLQGELKRIQKQTGTTFVFVTHDQEEALSMSDRIAVMHAGQVEQFSSAVETYRYPRTAFVASFVGDTNLFDATVAALQDTAAQVVTGPERAALTVPLRGRAVPRVGDKVGLSVRPESVRVGAASAGMEVRLRGVVSALEFAGPVVSYTLAAQGRTFVARQHGGEAMALDAQVGDDLAFGWSAADAVLVPCAA